MKIRNTVMGGSLTHPEMATQERLLDKNDELFVDEADVEDADE